MRWTQGRNEEIDERSGGRTGRRVEIDERRGGRLWTTERSDEKGEERRLGKE